MTSRVRLALTFAALTLPAGAGSAGIEALLQQGAAAYREKNYARALSFMADALALDPENGTAKNYIWTLAKKMAEAARNARPAPGELDRAEHAALAHIAQERVRAREALSRLKDAYEMSRNTRSPGDVLSALEGLDREVEKEFSDERTRVQARATFNRILANLGESLGKNHVDPADSLRISGYLAYYRGEWDEAAALWKKALAAAPGNARLRQELDNLTSLIRRRENEEKIQQLVQRAEAFAKTGYWAQSADAWKEVLALDPVFPGAKEKQALAAVSAEKTALQSRLKKKTDEGIALFQTGDSFAAAQIWLEVLQEDPVHEQARVWLKLVGKEISGKRTSPAAKTISTEKKTPQPPSADRKDEALTLHRQAILLYSEDKLKEAVVIWRRALSIDPALAQAQQALRQAQAELTLQE